MIPAADSLFFATSVPHAEAQSVRLWLARLKQIHFARNKTAAVRTLSRQLCAQGVKASTGTIWRKYYSYINSGDCKALIDHAKAPAERAGLPREFVQFAQRLMENNQRSSRAAFRELIHIWRAHSSRDGRTEYKTLPGYAAWPAADPRTGVPEGWTERNLYRYQSDKWSLTAGRIGRAAASAHRLPVFTTRVGLRVGQYFQFDDHEYDLKVKYPGQWRVMRPRGFTALDVLSACPFAKSFKPTLWDEAEEKKKALTEKDFSWFIVHVLCDFGYRTDDLGTVLSVEWGTAAIREEFELRILEATGGHVRVERSGKFGTEGQGRLAIASQFKGQPKGNFRFKSLVESFWNIINNEMAALTGQVGKDRVHSPEQLYGAEQYQNKLERIASVMPPEQAARLKSPFLTWPEFIDVALRYYQAISTTDQHAIRHWEECGFVAKEWRLTEVTDWMAHDRLLELGEVQQSLALALIEKNPLLHRARRMSRQEAFDAQRGELTPLPLHHLPTLLGPENAVRGGEALAVRNGIFEFEDRDMGASSLRFMAVDEDGHELRDKYVCFVNPFNPAALVACDAQLRVKAICPPMIEGRADDRESVKRAMGAARKWEAQKIAAYEERHAEDIRAKRLLHEHNGEVISGMTPREEAMEASKTEDLGRMADEAIGENAL